MSNITIECPRCHKEHTCRITTKGAARGGFNCECQMRILWSVHFDPRTFLFERPPNKGATKNE
jgi:hypothetical protein